MAEFSIDIDHIGHSISDLHTASGNLKNVSSEIQNIQGSIDMESESVRVVIKRLVYIGTDVLREAALMGNLAKALTYICEKYSLTERNISGDLSLSEKVLYTIDSTVYDIMKMLGLEELYNQARYRYDSFDEARTQEKLMDQYLQSKCQELMNQPEYCEETWNNATVEEREQIIRNFIVAVNAVLGTSTVINVIFDDGEGNTENNGYFSYEGNGRATIYINPNRVRNGDRRIFQTAIHESRHCYQHEAVEHPENFVVSEETLQKWEENFKNYIDGGEKGYYEQPIEWDAFNFAGQTERVEGRTPDYGGSWSTE